MSPPALSSLFPLDPLLASQVQSFAVSYPGLFMRFRREGNEAPMTAHEYSGLKKLVQIRDQGTLPHPLPEPLGPGKGKDSRKLSETLAVEQW